MYPFLLFLPLWAVHKGKFHYSVFLADRQAFSTVFGSSRHPCLTHSFNNKTTDEYIGRFDTTEELKIIQDMLKEITLEDVKCRYGSYPQAKRDSNIAIEKHFEEKLGKDIYTVVDKNDFRPCKKMTEVKFYESVADELLKFAVIIARSDDKWVFCKHKDRDTWEIPGGHRELDENIVDTAKRELYEETGALEFDIEPICAYSVTATDNFDGKETFGMLFYADIKNLESELHSEIEKITIMNELPEKWTYPNIQPKLMEEAKRKGYL